jgi:hypothetical protein
MYGGGPFDALSFAEGNIVGTLGIQSLSGNLHTVFVPELTVQMQGKYPIQFELGYQWVIR